MCLWSSKVLEFIISSMYSKKRFHVWAASFSFEFPAKFDSFVKRREGRETKWIFWEVKQWMESNFTRVELNNGNLGWEAWLMGSLEEVIEEKGGGRGIGNGDDKRG